MNPEQNEIRASIIKKIVEKGKHSIIDDLLVTTNEDQIIVTPVKNAHARKFTFDRDTSPGEIADKIIDSTQ